MKYKAFQDCLLPPVQCHILPTHGSLFLDYPLLVDQNPIHFTSLFFLSVLTFNYVLLIMLVQLFWFFPRCPSPPSTPYSLRQFLHHCSCPWVMCISLLATPFPILYLTSPWLFSNYLFALLNPLTCSPILPLPLPSGNLAVINVFSLAVFKSLSLSLTFSILIMMCFGPISLGLSGLLGRPGFPGSLFPSSD